MYIEKNVGTAEPSEAKVQIDWIRENQFYIVVYMCGGKGAANRLLQLFEKILCTLNIPQILI